MHRRTSAQLCAAATRANIHGWLAMVAALLVAGVLRSLMLHLSVLAGKLPPGAWQLMPPQKGRTRTEVVTGLLSHLHRGVTWNALGFRSSCR